MSVTDPTSNAVRTVVTQIAMPLERTGDTAPPTAGDNDQPIGAESQAPTPAAVASCETLSLALGPVDLNLVGLNVQLDRVNVDLTATEGTSVRLGAMLCAVASLVDGTGRPGELVRSLNALLDMVG